MSTEKSGSSSKNLVVAAIALLIAAAGAWWFLAGPQGVPEEATLVAAQVPADTPLLVWTADLDTLLSLAKDAGFDGEALAKDGGPLRGLVETIGHNPVTAEGLRGLGIDTMGPLALFLGPADAPDLLLGLYIPMTDVSGIALAQDLAEKLGIGERINFEGAEVAGNAVAWVTRKKGSSAGALVAAIIDINDAALLVFPFDFKHRHAERIGDAIRAWATALAEGPKESLADIDAFRPALAGYDDALLGGFFHPSDGAREIKLQEDGIQMAFWILASAQGAGFRLADDGPALRLQLRTVLSSADVAPGRTRDRDVLDRIPGHPIAGLHLALDFEKALAELERSLPKKAYEGHSLVRAIRASGPALGLEDGETFIDLLNGELAIFVGEADANLPDLMKATIGFVGVQNRGATEDILKGLIESAGMTSARETVEDATLFVLETPIGEAGVLVEDDRIWFGGSAAALRRVARGEEGELTEGDRNKTIAAVMREDSALAIFVDLEKVVELLPDTGDGPVREILAELDYLTMSAGNDRAAVESELSLYAKGDSFRTAVLPKVAVALKSSGFGGRSRKVEERRHRP